MLFLAGCARGEPAANPEYTASTLPVITHAPSATPSLPPTPEKPTDKAIPTATERLTPAWFDSLYIAYSQNRGPGIWMWSDGEGVQLSAEFPPMEGTKIRICDDGGFVAYTTRGILVLYDRKTGAETSFSVGTYLGTLEEFAWIPGSHELVFTTSQSSSMDHDGAFISWATGLYKVSPGSAEWNRILGPDKAAVNFFLSGDGGKNTPGSFLGGKHRHREY
jgi:hypothetical protein